MSLTLTLERGGSEVSGSGTNIELEGTIAGGAIESVEMLGDTEQATVPSPSPDYPQEVQTVTGEQTITISDGGSQSETYTLNLGSIELCKIGDYQDYIYKSGDDWYIHKETGFLTLDTSKIQSAYELKYRYAKSDIPNSNIPINSSNFICKHFTVVNNSTGGIGTVYAGGSMINFRYDEDGSDLSGFKAWAAAVGLSLYYVLATPTDTQITDSTLIGQLNALNGADTYDGTTVITVSSESLAGPLEVTASTSIAKTYTEVEIGSPFTIADVEGKSSNTTLDGNVYVDWAYNKKQYSFDLFNLTPQDYADIRAFYDYQFNNSAFPTITVPELNIEKLPVYMEISSRNIVNQCLLTDKLTIKFRETVQP